MTRAEHQADNLCRLIRQAGGRPIRFPALQIAGPAEPSRVRYLLAHIQRYDLAVFISPNAVDRGLRLLPQGLPETLQIAAVGRATAAALRAGGRPADLVPTGCYDSDALLALPEFSAVDGRRVIIFRGNGGRPLLGETLRQRGAEVDYVEIYRRLCPDVDAGPLLSHWREQVHLVTVTSSGILDNLCKMLGGPGLELLRNTPLLVISPRLQEQAGKIGCREVIVAQRADDQSIVNAACAWWEARNSV